MRKIPLKILNYNVMKNIFLAVLVLVSIQLFAQEKPNIIWLMAEDMSLDLE
jgi:uncharacterized sulfatase